MKLNDIYIEFLFKDIDHLSDNTLRKLLKEYSKITRKILIDEIDFILSELNLLFRQRQSLTTIIKNKSLNKPNYYVDKIEKGSLTVIAIISTSTLYILNQTLGKSFERAWENSNLSNVENLMLGAFNKLYEYLKNRPEKIKKITNQFNEKVLGEKYKVKSIKKGEKESIITIEIEPINKPDRIIVDANFIEIKILKEIKKIKKTIKDK